MQSQSTGDITQLSLRTIKILENFVGINSGIVIRKTSSGEDKTLIATIDSQSILYAEALVDEVFPTNVCLYDLKGFLSVLSSLPDPQVEFRDNDVVISSGASKARITYADPAHIVHPQNAFPVQEADVSFDLSEDHLSQVLSMGNVLGLKHLRIFSHDGKINMQACDAKTPNSSTFDIEVGKTDEDFDVYISRDNIKMIPGDYTVRVATDKLAIFEHAVTPDLFYCVSLERISQ